MSRRGPDLTLLFSLPPESSAFEELKILAHEMQNTMMRIHAGPGPGERNRMQGSGLATPAGGHFPGSFFFQRACCMRAERYGREEVRSRRCAFMKGCGSLLFRYGCFKWRHLSELPQRWRAKRLLRPMLYERG